MNEINDLVLDGMKKKVESFPEKYQGFFSGKISEEELTQHVSQPFWQSMHLTKKRLDKKGLLVDVKMRRKSNAGNVKVVDSKTSNNIDAGEFKQNIILEKKIYKGNKVVYKEKDGYVSTFGAIKIHGENDTATCPRCGAVAKISTFVDGCDFCDSKFKVSDFEEKISALSFRKDGRRKVKKAYLKSFLTMAGVFALFLLMATISFGYFVISSITDNVSQNLYANMTVAIALQSLPTIYKTVFLALFIMGVISLIMAFKIKDVRIIENNISAMIKDKIAYFSVEDFVQNIEYKIRNIHFAENVNEIEKFSTVDLSTVIEKYENVIECDLRNIQFTDFRVDNELNQYDITVLLNLGLTTIRNKKVKNVNEKLYITLSRKLSIETKNISSIREFTCCSCGSTIDMLNGGVCSHCGESIDYSEYDWMITGYYSNVKKDSEIKEGNVIFGTVKEMEYYKKARMTINALFVGASLIVFAIVLFQNRNVFYFYSVSDEIDVVCKKECDEIKKLTELETGYLTKIELIEVKEEICMITYRYQYSGDLQAHLNEYKEMLINEYDYKNVPEPDGEWVVEKKDAYENGVIEGSMYVIVEEKDNNIVEIAYVLEEEGMYD